MIHRSDRFAAAALMFSTAALLTVCTSDDVRADVFTNGQLVIYRYNDAGARVGSVTAGSEEWADVVRSPDGFLYATSNILGTGSLYRIDPTSGASTLAATSTPAVPYTVPTGLAFNALGIGFVGSNTFAASSAAILRFDPIAGTLAPFAAVSGTNAYVGDLAVSPAGDVYAASNGNVFRFNGTTGAPSGVAVPASSGLVGPGAHIAFGPDGALYVSDASDTINRLEPNTGSLLGSFVSAIAGGAHSVSGLSFGLDGKLYVNDGAHGRILRYDATSGAFLDVFTSDAGDIRPSRWESAVVPEPAMIGTAAAALGCLVKRRRSVGNSR